MELKTSKEWCEQLDIAYNGITEHSLGIKAIFKILDFDGWGKWNWTYPFYYEKITLDRFIQRAKNSTTANATEAGQKLLGIKNRYVGGR